MPIGVSFDKFDRPPSWNESTVFKSMATTSPTTARPPTKFHMNVPVGLIVITGTHRPT